MFGNEPVLIFLFDRFFLDQVSFSCFMLELDIQILNVSFGPAVT